MNYPREFALCFAGALLAVGIIVWRIYREVIPVKVGIKFEPRDLWVGVYWRRDRIPHDVVDFGTEDDPYPLAVWRPHVVWRVYVCLVPCFPIIFERRIDK